MTTAGAGSSTGPAVEERELRCWTEDEPPLPDRRVRGGEHERIAGIGPVPDRYASATALACRSVDLIEELVPLRDRAVAVLRPRDSEALLDEDAFEHEEMLPYWAELWPSGVALARAVSGAALGGRRVLELGCGGLALPSIAAALAGARVLATDWAPDALELARENARRNGAQVDVKRVAWDAPQALLERAPWDLVLAADVLYERRNLDLLVPLLPRLGRTVWLADPGRPPLEDFLKRAGAHWEVGVTRDPTMPRVGVHRLRRRT